ncbi:MAG: transcriptional repressor, partial [Alphaproteobacteria bacterium]
MAAAGLRPTRQRLALAGLLFSGPLRHVTAESLHGECQERGVTVSLATVYNTLHQFT